MDLDAQRTAIRPLLAPSAPEDALTAYYALYHDPRRVQLTLHHAPGGDTCPGPVLSGVEEQNRRLDGFIAVCQTGQDLFRPLVVIRAADDAAVVDLLNRALVPGRPYYMIAPIELARTLQRLLVMPEPAVHCIYRVDPARFQSTRTAEINVLLQERRDSDGLPRWEIHSRGRVAAAAGTNWRSPFCAEVYVYTEPEFRRRGWGRAVLQAATAELLLEGLLPLYRARDDNLPSILLAKAAGYADTGRREVAGEVYLRAP